MFLLLILCYFQYNNSSAKSTNWKNGDLNMSTLVIVGSQWGDEGKGKITDYIAQESDVVVRSQGGNNAGHTISFGGEKFALRSIPLVYLILKLKMLWQMVWLLIQSKCLKN